MPRNSHTGVGLNGSASGYSSFLLLIVSLWFLPILILVSMSNFLTETLATWALIKHISSHGTIKVSLHQKELVRGEEEPYSKCTVC